MELNYFHNFMTEKKTFGCENSQISQCPTLKQRLFFSIRGISNVTVGRISGIDQECAYHYISRINFLAAI